MRLPQITHLQFMVLGTLLSGEQPGSFIRGRLAKAKVRQTGPAFYQMMARLEDTGLVKGWYVNKTVKGQIVKERRYRLKKAGARCWEETRDFYLANVRAVEGTTRLAEV